MGYVRADKAIAAASVYVDSLRARMPIKDPALVREQAAEFEGMLYDIVIGNRTKESEYLAGRLDRTMTRLGVPPEERQQAVVEIQESVRLAVRAGRLPMAQFRRLDVTLLELMLE